MSIRRNYFWIVALAQEEGKPDKPYLVFGSDKSEDDARQKGLELLGGTNFEIRKLPTRNLARASSLLKGNRLEQTQSLREAGRRIGHDKSLKRRRRRSISNNW